MSFSLSEKEGKRQYLYCSHEPQRRSETHGIDRAQDSGDEEHTHRCDVRFHENGDQCNQKRTPDRRGRTWIEI